MTEEFVVMAVDDSVDDLASLTEAWREADR